MELSIFVISKDQSYQILKSTLENKDCFWKPVQLFTSNSKYDFIWYLYYMTEI